MEIVNKIFKKAVTVFLGCVSSLSIICAYPYEKSQPQNLSAFKPVPSRCLTLDSDNILTFSDSDSSYISETSSVQIKKHIQEKKPKTPKYKTAGKKYKDSYCDHCGKVTMSYHGSKMEDGKIRHFPRCDECENEKTITHNWKAKCATCGNVELTDHVKYGNKIKCCKCRNATFTFKTLEYLHGKIDGENLAYFCETHGNLTNEQLYYNKAGFLCKQCAIGY